MAPVFSRDAWRCVWHMIQVKCLLFLFSFANIHWPVVQCLFKRSLIMSAPLWAFQNDLVHGWGLDFALRKCVEVSLLSHQFIKI